MNMDWTGVQPGDIKDSDGEVIKISELPSAEKVSPDDLLIVNQNNGVRDTTRKASLSKVFGGSIEEAKEASRKAKQEADRSENEADRAAASAQMAITADHVYPTAEAAQNAINDGTEKNEFFWVRSTRNGLIVEEYQNVAGTATPVGRGILSDELMRDVLNGVRWNSNDEILLDVTDPDSLSLWRLLSDGTFGTILTKMTPNGPATKNMSLMFDESFEGLRFQDPDGLYVTLVDEKGVVAPQAFHNSPSLAIKPTDDSWLTMKDLDGFYQKVIDKAGNLYAGGIRLSRSDKGWLTLQDGDGFFKVVIDNQGNVVGTGNTPAGDDFIAKRNASNLAYSATVKSNHNPNIKRLSAAINHIIWDGQSLSNNQEGWPALTRDVVPRYDNLMIGDSPRPANRTNTSFTPIGGAVFKPLKSVVQSLDGATILNDAQVAALPRGGGNQGEGGVAAVNMLRKMYLDHYSLDRDPSRRFLLSQPGVDGRSIEQLSVGASPEIYNRVRESVSLAKQLSGTDSYAVSTIVWIQGEWNYRSQNGSNDKNTYKLNMGKLFDDITQTAKDAAGDDQWQRPPVFMYQTGGQYTVDSTKMSIGMAQFEFCKENDYAYLATPAYPFPDKGGHCDSNGYRWMDMQFGKVMYKVQILGEGWEPLHPIKIDRADDGRSLYVSYHVPSPPLQFRPCYANSTAYMFDDKGFSVTDLSGTAVAISSVEIVADTIIKITCANSIPASAALWYGDARNNHRGGGNVFDSDDFQATEIYEYEEGRGFYPEANIPELVGKPYPLNNASVQWYQTF